MVSLDVDHDILDMTAHDTIHNQGGYGEPGCGIAVAIGLCSSGVQYFDRGGRCAEGM